MYYAEFFRLTEAPFSIAPNPRYLFMSERHREALAHLLYGVRTGNGFVALTGEVGTGKTTLCNCLLDQLPDNVDLALVLNPRVNAEELLATLCDELGVAYPQKTTRIKVLVDALNAHLLKVHAQGRSTVLLIDEAQNLSTRVLEQIRLLTNLETNETKLLQIILVGQPELNHLLSQKNLRQLNQRITARFHIDPLSLAECSTYIEHRLKIAGTDDPVFTVRAVKKVFQLSGGIPRLINIICDRAMLGAYSLGTHRVDARIVEKAASEVLLPRPSLLAGHRKSIVALALIGLVSGLYLFGFPPMLPVTYTGDTSVSARPAGTTATVPQFGTESRIYEEMYGHLAPASSGADFEIEPQNQSADQRGPLIRDNAGGGQDADLTGRQPTKTDQPRVRFIDRISNPESNLVGALPQLFRQWNINIEPISDNFCQTARRSGLQCLTQHGTWNYLVRLNRPAILEFALQPGEPRYATLVGVDDDAATFEFPGGDPVSFPIAEVLPFWQGQFTLLWKPPAPDAVLLVQGYSNPAVAWLRETLFSIRGTPAENLASIYFDKKLEDEVIAFQLEHGLNPDGKVGSETITFLNSLSNSPDVPRLYPNRN